MLTLGIILGAGSLCAVCIYANLRRESFKSFVAERFAEDAGANWSDPYGDIPSPITNPSECVDALHRSGECR